MINVSWFNANYWTGLCWREPSAASSPCPAILSLILKVVSTKRDSVVKAHTRPNQNAFTLDSRWYAEEHLVLRLSWELWDCHRALKSWWAASKAQCLLFLGFSARTGLLLGLPEVTALMQRCQSLHQHPCMEESWSESLRRRPDLHPIPAEEGYIIICYYLSPGWCLSTKKQHRTQNMQQKLIIRGVTFAASVCVSH